MFEKTEIEKTKKVFGVVLEHVLDVIHDEYYNVAFTPGDEYSTFDFMFSIEVFEEDGKILDNICTPTSIPTDLKQNGLVYINRTFSDDQNNQILELGFCIHTS